MEENPQISENLNDWEQIQSLYWPQPTSTAATGTWADGAAAEFKDGFIFPPDHHESLPVPQPVSSPVESTPEEEDVVSSEGFSGSAWRHVGLLRCGIVRVAVAAGNFGRWRGVFWTFGGMAGVVMVATWLWVRLRRWQPRFRRNRGESLVELIRERDQKIKQLLLQMSQMNELLSARRSVPVIRIVS